MNNRIDLIRKQTEVETMLKFVTDTIKIVETHFHKKFDENSSAYYRFVMHLKGLIKRISMGKLYYDDAELYDTIAHSCPEAAKCAEKVAKVFDLKYKQKLSTEEKAYLTLYIEKLNRE